MLGPHFQFDLIRLARKGWPTLLRCTYLAVLLIALAVMYRSAGEAVKPSDFAARAQRYANTLVALQAILALLFLPVYLASAIAEEKENATLEATFLTPITDREIVFGKYWARCLHVGAVILAGFPLLVFMHLWGNVDIYFLIFHSANTFLLLLSGGSICIWVSTQSETAFQAITRSYSRLAILGFFSILVAFSASTSITFNAAAAQGMRRNTGLWYLPGLAALIVAHLLIMRHFLRDAVYQMIKVRRAPLARPKKMTAAFALADTPRLKSSGPQKRASNINPLAWPIRGPALFWKECLKDGTKWSLDAGWLIIACVLCAGAAVFYRMIQEANPPTRQTDLAGMAGAFTYTAYFLCIGVYLMVVVFQITLSVAGEREQDTLVFLRLIPEDARAILVYKWLGPFWKNWPIIAVANLGALTGLACGLYSPRTALFMCLLPWPFFLMMSFFALCLSVLCRRVLFANIIMAGFVLALIIGHVAASAQIGIVYHFYSALVFEMRPWYVAVLGGGAFDVATFPWRYAAALALAHQGTFLAVATTCGVLAFWKFEK